MAHSFPAPWTAYIHRYNPAAVNDHNIPVKAYDPPREQRGNPIKVIQWETSSVSEPQPDNSVYQVNLYIPPVLRNPAGNAVDLPGWMDLIDLPAPKGGFDQFEVKGIRDCTHGFHGWKAGYMVELERVI